MINQERLAEILVLYKQDFATRWQKGESFKWEAIKWFQDHWDIDAPNFGEMLNCALDHTESLLVSKYTFPRGMIVEYATSAPEDVRSIDYFAGIAPVRNRVPHRAFTV